MVDANRPGRGARNGGELWAASGLNGEVSAMFFCLRKSVLGGLVLANKFKEAGQLLVGGRLVIKETPRVRGLVFPWKCSPVNGEGKLVLGVKNPRS